MVDYADVVWASLPDRGGHEQMGRRPVIVWQDVVAFPTTTYVIIPLATQLDSLKYPGTVLIQPSPTNGLSKPSVALVFQLGAHDVRRLDDQPIGHLDDPDLQAIQALAKLLMKLP